MDEEASRFASSSAAIFVRACDSIAYVAVCTFGYHVSMVMPFMANRDVLSPPARATQDTQTLSSGKLRD